jgi:hypothetical protein
MTHTVDHSFLMAVPAVPESRKNIRIMMGVRGSRQWAAVVMGDTDTGMTYNKL